MIGGLRTESWSYKTAVHGRDAKVWRAHAGPQGRCDNLINALMLLPNRQKDGGGPVKMVVPGLLEKSRLRMMDGLRKFVPVDTHAPGKIGIWRETKQIFRERWFGKERMSSHCAHMKREQCALSSTPRMWETKDGGHRSWTKTGTPSARPGHLQDCRRSGMGDHVLQLCRTAQGSQRQEIWRKQEGKALWSLTEASRQRDIFL